MKKMTNKYSCSQLLRIFVGLGSFDILAHAFFQRWGFHVWGWMTFSILFWSLLVFSCAVGMHSEKPN